MKKLIGNINVVKGDLLGGEIEPGTFHTLNIPIISRFQKADAHFITDTEEPPSDEANDDGNSTAKDGPESN